MVAFANESIHNSGLTDRAEANVGDYRNVRFADMKFDAVISNFGGINFSESVSPVFANMGMDIRPGGIFLINSVTHFCLLEFLIFLSKGQFSKATRRVAGGNARIGGKNVQLFYHTMSSFRNAAAENGFQLIDSFGLNILAPPLWADDFFTRHSDLSALLEHADSKIRRWPVLRASGDFMVLVFQKH